MRSLITVITDILNSESEIPEIENLALKRPPKDGQTVVGTVDKPLFRKVARLQTLIVKEDEKSEPLSDEQIENEASRTGTHHVVVLGKSQFVARDAASNIKMLSRLIVEVIRETCPAECERFEVRYIACSDFRIYAIEAAETGSSF